MTASVFRYVAVDRRGRKARGTIQSPHAATARAELAGRGFVVVSLDVSTCDARHQGRAFERHVLALTFTRALAPLLSAGLSLTRALESVETSVPTGFAPVVRLARTRVQRGEALAHALEASSSVFSPLYIGLVAAGETGGDLRVTFERLAAQMEKEARFRSSLLSALAYPCLLATIGSGALLAIMFFVLPRFADLFADTGATLPVMTSALLGATHIARTYAPLFAVIAAMCGAALGAALRSRAGRVRISRMTLRLPFLGAVRRDVIAARFARSTSALLVNSTPLLVALRTSATTLGDPFARSELERIARDVRNGISLSDASASSAIAPPVLLQLMRIGEQTGQLGIFLSRAADLLEETVERRLGRLVTFIEPGLILILGGVIGLVAMSLLQAVYGMNADMLR